jgi:hypothetical protein
MEGLREGASNASMSMDNSSALAHALRFDLSYYASALTSSVDLM